MLFRSEDYRKLWRRKKHVQLIAVFIGAILGSLPGMMDRGLADFPHWVIESAIISSTVANTVSLFYY